MGLNLLFSFYNTSKNKVGICLFVAMISERILESIIFLMCFNFFADITDFQVFVFTQTSKI